MDKWLLQLGFSYDTSPVDSDDRTPDMPIDRQIRYATGVQYQWSDRLSVGGEFVYADYGKAKIDNDLLKGEYKRNDIFFFALNANWNCDWIPTDIFNLQLHKSGTSSQLKSPVFHCKI